MYRFQLPDDYSSKIPADGFECDTPEELFERLGIDPSQLSNIEPEYVHECTWNRMGHSDCVAFRESLYSVLKLAGKRKAAKSYTAGWAEANAYRAANGKCPRPVA